MIRVVIRGYAAVYRGDELVTDPAILQSLSGLTYDAERFTDYLDFSGRIVPEEKALLEALEPGGGINFVYRADDPLLTATTEYVSRRLLSSAELLALAAYTMGQWSDGIGENLWCLPFHATYGFFCLWSREDVKSACPAAEVGQEYPTIEVTDLEWPAEPDGTRPNNRTGTRYEEKT